MNKYTDTDLLDFLEQLHKENGYSEYCTLRDSMSGRGWRLHSLSGFAAETFGIKLLTTVREAISNYMENDND